MTSPQLQLTVLAVEDVERSRAFYEAVLDAAPAVAVPVFVQFDTPGAASLGLYQRGGFELSSGGRLAPGCAPGHVGAGEVYLRCDDPEAVLARAIAAGGCALSPFAPRDWGDDVAYVADPDGHVVALARHSR